MWDGATERRKENLNLMIEFASFKATMDEFMKTTTEYRKQLCIKIDKIDTALSNHITEVTEKINLLPCREQVGIYNSINKQIKYLWAIITGIMLAIINSWIRQK